MQAKVRLQNFIVYDIMELQNSKGGRNWREMWKQTVAQGHTISLYQTRNQDSELTELVLCAR